MNKTLSDCIKDFQDSKKSPNTLLEDEAGNVKRRKEYTRLELLRIKLNKWWVFVLAVLAVAQVFQAVYTTINKKGEKLSLEEEWKRATPIPLPGVGDGLLTKNGHNEEMRLPDGTIVYKVVIDERFYYIVTGKAGVAIIPRLK